MKIRASRSIGGNILVFFILLLFGLFFMLPIVYAVITAFKPMSEILVFPPRLFVRRPTLSNLVWLNYIMADFWVPLSRYLFNSLFITLVGTAGHIVLASMAAYPLAKHRFYGRQWLSRIIVLSLLFTASVTYIPQYVVLGATRLIDTYWSVILIALQSSLGLYLMMNFMQRIPDEMLEAARIDGAKEFRIFWTVVMPNVKPAWLTLAIFQFQQMWGNTGSLFLRDEQLKPMQYALQQITAGGVSRAGAAAAVTFIIMAVPVLFFLLCQSSILETMTTSGMKD